MSVVTVLNETRHSGGFIVSEANGFRSRDLATIVNAGTADVQLVAGTVLAAAGEGADAVIAAGTNTGNGTLGSLTFGAAAKPGVYTVTLTAATVYRVTDPAGDVLTSTGATGAAFSDPQIGFTVTAGGTPFAANDTFTITVPDFTQRATVLSNVSIGAPVGTGNGTLGSLAWGNVFYPGKYVVTFSSASAFTVADPKGAALGAGTVGTAYSKAQLGFTITAGTTPFANTDTITITVPSFSNHMGNWLNAAPAVAIAYNTEIIAAGGYAQVTVVARSAEVNAAELVFDPAISGSTNPTFGQLLEIAAAQLRTVGIILR